MFPMQVEFPKLGISFSIDNVAFTVFGKDIYWYAVIITAGMLLAFVYAVLNIKRFKIDLDPLTDVAIVGIIFGIIGARAYYVIFNWDMYSQNPSDIIRIDKGGLAIYGGVIGAFVSGFIMTKILKMNSMATADIAGMGFLIGQGVGRWGNFINQEAFGTATELPWGMMSMNTGGVAVHPCFLYESVWCLVGFIALHFISKYARKFDGQIFLMYIGWYGLGRFWIEGLRTDSLWLVDNVIRVSQLVAGICVLASVVLLILGYKGILFSRVSDDIDEDELEIQE